MTPKGSPLLHDPGGDNTPQGKLARGCMYVFAWIAGAMILAALAEGAQHLLCAYGHTWACP